MVRLRFVESIRKQGEIVKSRQLHLGDWQRSKYLCHVILGFAHFETEV